MAQTQIAEDSPAAHDTILGHTTSVTFRLPWFTFSGYLFINHPEKYEYRDKLFTNCSSQDSKLGV